MNTKRANRHKMLLVAVAGVGLGLMETARADVAEVWGSNYYGQLGNGSTITSPPYGIASPVAVSGLGNTITAVAAGGDHGLAIQDGAVKAWGRNSDGQLGNGSVANSSTPVAVSGLGSGVTAVAGGYLHSLAIQNGVAKAWGYNANGQLGNGSTATSITPVTVSGLTSGVTVVAGGGYHSLAIHNGAVKAWGYNGDGQLGNGTTTNSSTPVTVSGLGSGVTAVAAGFYHNLAIQNGAAKAWGYNIVGQLGNGSTTTSSTPVTVSGLFSGVTAVAGGYYHSLAIRNGNVYAWGTNVQGQLGNGTFGGKSTVPILAVDTPADFVAVAAAAYSSYALSSDGSLWVWGYNGEGQLGVGNMVSYETPQHLLPPSGYRFTRIDADALGGHSLATLTALTPGDANGDGVVDSVDFGILASNYGRVSGVSFQQADFNADGRISTLDFNILAGHFGPGSASSLGTVVPEPASLGLLATGGVATIALRRRMTRGRRMTWEHS